MNNLMFYRDILPMQEHINQKKNYLFVTPTITVLTFGRVARMFLKIINEQVKLTSPRKHKGQKSSLFTKYRDID